MIEWEYSGLIKTRQNLILGLELKIKFIKCTNLKKENFNNFSILQILQNI